MYNRYQGNTGQFVRMQDPQPSAVVRPLPQERQMPVPNNQERPQRRPSPERAGGLGSLLSFDGIQEKVSGLLSQVLSDGLETEDLILMLILYLMYKESGDTELLIILGAMFLL